MADWEGLHEDVLVLILEKIKLIEDFVAFGMVWNEAATSNNKQYLRPQIPWLMLVDETTKNGRRQIYNLSSLKDDDDDKISSNSNMRCLYFSPDRRCIGLNHGWMLMISRLGGHLNLLHPISDSEIKLPNHTSIESYDTHETWPCYLFTHKAAISGNPSESSDFTLMIAHSGGSYLGYWRPGNTCWTSKFDTHCGFYDLIYNYKGAQFYAIT